MDLLWTDFLNSEWHDWRGSGRSEDRLEKPGWLEGWTQRWELALPPALTPVELGSLRELRGLVLRMARQGAAGQPQAEADVQALNACMERAPYLRRLVPAEEGAGLRLEQVPLRGDAAALEAAVAASFAVTLTEGETSRIRVCGNPDCLWVFYDDTRSRTKKFCDDKLCGNLMKVRRFRERKKQGDGGEG